LKNWYGGRDFNWHCMAPQGREIAMSGHQFITWAGPGGDPTFEKMDIESW